MPKRIDHREKILVEMKKMLYKEKSSQEIHEYIRENYPVSRQNVVFLLNEAKENIKREIDFNIRDLMIKNSARYEKIYWKNFKNPFSKVLDNPDDDLEDQDARKTLIKVANHYWTAIESMQQKEKMLGIVHNRMDIQLKNELAESETKKLDSEISPSNIDVSKLTLEEKKEFLRLLNKSKGEVEETTKVTTTVSVNSAEKEVEVAKYEEVVDKFEIEDVDYEEMPEPSVMHTHNINKGILKEEAKKLDDKIKAQRDKEFKDKLQKNKQKLLAKYKKSK